MLQIKEIVNSIFTSKTYILYCEGEDKTWIVDIGDIEPVIAFCKEKRLTVKGVFLTHTHFDHIYGLLSLLDYYPDCKVYTNDYGRCALASDKLNMSKYHETPIQYEGNNVVLIHEGEEVVLFDRDIVLQIYETPGHNPSCLTMTVGDVIFTGDAYIPGVGTNTQLPHADKLQAQQSLDKVLSLARGKKVYSGHLV